MYENIREEKVRLLLQEMMIQFKDIDIAWMNFYTNIYKFKEQKTDYGYMDIELEDKSIVKKSSIVKQLFNVSQSLYSRITSLVDRFFILDNCNNLICIRGDVRDFNRSNLMELLYLEEEQLTEALENGDISPTTSVSQIRKYIKSLKQEEDKIPTKEELLKAQQDLMKTRSLNVHNHITNTDLERMTKGQIVLMYLELQSLYESLKERKK